MNKATNLAAIVLMSGLSGFSTANDLDIMALVSGLAAVIVSLTLAKKTYEEGKLIEANRIIKELDIKERKNKLKKQ